MILVTITDKSEKKIIQIAQDLLELKMLIDVDINNHITRFNGIESVNYSTLTAKTKALLFQDINDRIKSIWEHNMPEIYSTPIIHMDWEQSKRLMERIEKV